MTRVKRGTCARQRRKKLLHLNRSYSGVHSRLFRQAKQQRFKALTSSFVNRKKFQRETRGLWIQRIQCGLKSNLVYFKQNEEVNSLKYNMFIHNLKKKNILFNRKILAQMVLLDPKTFSQLLNYIRNGTS
uniref:Large ribosomal subunit protein bL20c n=1 Tax=Microrhizoidea pickettheapsiorum TaxID=2604950 RepID=A0A5B9RGS0_9CHLO|nr:ribosomal protein L20 [Microrhizoidea pickettheapsiorum]QEG77704.1 ribosomal protein L20 [Microrhizoidea pickettheapsiorum]